MEISVCPVPLALRAGQLDGSVAVVIDVLRMTSVAITALENGCTAILPVETVEQARAAAEADNALLGGERGALRIEGFDFANSPLEYMPARVAGRPLVMTTSNGTRALLAARPAAKVVLGSMINVDAVAEHVAGMDKVCFVCAGTNDAFSLEDALAAGAMIDRLSGAALDDMALASLQLYRQARGDIHAALAHTLHYGRLKRLGFDADLTYCLAEGTHSRVPVMREDGWIL